MSKVLVSGGNGKFAHCLRKIESKYSIWYASKSWMDVTNLDRVLIRINQVKPKYFIHAGALTRPLIKHEENPELSIRTNIIGTANVVTACIQNNIKLIYLSTDYVYPGIDGNYKEDDPLLPFTNYGWSKLGGECAVQIYKNSLILRLGMIEHPFPHDTAFTNMIKSCMYNHEIAKITLQLLDKFGVINVGGPAQSVYDFVMKDNPNVFMGMLFPLKNSDTSMNTNKMDRILDDNIQ